MSDAINAALAAAEKEAAETPAPNTAVAQAPAASAGLPVTGGAPRSLTDSSWTARP